MYVRTALIRVPAHRKEECRRVYGEVVLPGIRAYPGNVFAHCLEPVVPGDPWLVITAWVDLAASDAYGASSMRDSFVAKVKSLLEGETMYRQYQSID